MELTIPLFLLVLGCSAVQTPPTGTPTDTAVFPTGDTAEPAPTIVWTPNFRTSRAEPWTGSGELCTDWGCAPASSGMGVVLPAETEVVAWLEIDGQPRTVFPIRTPGTDFTSDALVMVPNHRQTLHSFFNVVQPAENGHILQFGGIEGQGTLIDGPTGYPYFLGSAGEPHPPSGAVGLIKNGAVWFPDVEAGPHTLFLPSGCMEGDRFHGTPDDGQIEVVLEPGDQVHLAWLTCSQ